MKLRVSVFLLSFLVFGAIGWGQVDGIITGRVEDTSGARIPGVTISLTSPAIQGIRTLITDETGNYRFQSLPPGTFAVKYELPGFKTLIREGIIVEAGRSVTLNIALEVAAMAETVTVSGESPVVDVEQAKIGVNFGSAIKDNIVNSRDYWALLAVTPGIKTTTPDVGGSTMGSQVGYRAYGRSGQVQVMLDGVNLTEGNNSGSMYGDYGSWEEVAVSSAANSAEMATAGSAVTAVVRSGGNRVRGTAYLGYEKSGFQASNIDDNLRNQGITAGDKFTRYTDWNFDIGGPILKDRFWYYGSFRNEYSGLATELRQNSGARYTLPASGIAPNLCGPGQLPCIGDNPDGAPRGGLFYTRLTNGTVKLNYQINPTNQLSTTANLRLKFQPYRGGQGTGARDLTPDATQEQQSWFHIINAVWTSTLSNRTTLNVSMNNFGYYWVNLPKVTGQIRIFDRGTTGATRSYTQGSYISDLNNNRRWHENVALTQFFEAGGAHNMKIGYGFLWEDYRGSTKGYPDHVRYVFNAGRPERLEVFNTPVQWQQNSLLNHNFYIQDKWNISRKLTLNAGIRMDYYYAYLPRQVRESAGANPFNSATDIRGLESFGNQEYAQRSVLKTTNFVPRISLIYDVFGNGKTAVKASYGIFVFNPSYDLADNALDNEMKTTIFNWNGMLPVNTPAGLRACLNSGGCTLNSAPNLATTEIDPNLKLPTIHEYTFGVDQQIWGDWNLRFNFVRKIDQGAYGVLNQAYATTDFAPFQFNDPGRDGVAGTNDDAVFTAYNRTVAARPDRPVVVYSESSGDMFRTWELEAVKRMSNKWQLITGVDWTKRDLGPWMFNNDPNILINQSRVPNGHYWDWTGKFVVTYQMPYGFNFSTVFKSQKGEAPVQSTTSTFPVLGGRALQVNCDRLVAPGQTCAQAGGAAPRQGSFNIVRESQGAEGTFYPTLSLWDLRISKTIGLGERLGKAEFIFDLFNATNANTIRGWTLTTGTTRNVDASVAPTYQRPTVILNPRIFRLGAKWTF